MSWPHAERPGEPADPSRPWHWVARSDDGGLHPLPISWTPHLRHWVTWDGATLAPAEAAARFRYLGPCLTPAESEARVAQAAAAPPREVPPGELRGLAGLGATSIPDPPPTMVFKKDAIRNHLLIFAGTLFGTLFLIDKFNLMR